MAAAPPSQWADLGSLPRPANQMAPATDIGDLEQVSGAWKHVRNVVAHDARTPDLYELLSHSVRETQYSFQPSGVSCRLRWFRESPNATRKAGREQQRQIECLRHVDALQD